MGKSQAKLKVRQFFSWTFTEIFFLKKKSSKVPTILKETKYFITLVKSDVSSVVKKKSFCNYYTGKVFFYIVTNLVIAYFTFIISPTTKSTITRVHLYSNIFYYFLHFIAPSTWILFCLTFYVYNAHLFLCYFFTFLNQK